MEEAEAPGMAGMETNYTGRKAALGNLCKMLQKFHIFVHFQ